MKAWSVNVGVALARPPAIHQWRHCVVWAADEVEAVLVACQMASCTGGTVMPVYAELEM